MKTILKPVQDAFRLRVKDIMYGTLLTDLFIDDCLSLIKEWNEGKDLIIEGHELKNKFIEYIYFERLMQ